MDTGVRLALSNQGAFGESEHAKNRGLWVREGVFTSKLSKNRSLWVTKLQTFSQIAATGEKFANSVFRNGRGLWVIFFRNGRGLWVKNSIKIGVFG